MVDKRVSVVLSAGALQSRNGIQVPHPCPRILHSTAIYFDLRWIGMQDFGRSLARVSAESVENRGCSEKWLVGGSMCSMSELCVNVPACRVRPATTASSTCFSR